jgi:MFS-type transporter involved in bile tolerance (Atg22 family)
VIATTFSIEVLNFSTFDSGIAFLIFVFFSAIGCYISPISLKRINPIKSDQLSLFFIGLSTALAVAFMSSVEHRNLYFVFAIFWGLAAGWKYTIGA